MVIFIYLLTVYRQPYSNRNKRCNGSVWSENRSRGNVVENHSKEACH